jgi:hypothetical protein
LEDTDRFQDVVETQLWAAQEDHDSTRKSLLVLFFRKEHFLPSIPAPCRQAARRDTVTAGRDGTGGPAS